MYLHAVLIVVCHGRGRRYFVLQPHSFAVFPTDVLGAYAIRLFLLGSSASAIEAKVERRCPGAGKRWRHFRDGLYDVGAIGPCPPTRTPRWWVQRSIALALGPVLSMLNALLRLAPLWMLQDLCERVPGTPLGRRAFGHLIPFIDANLRAAGYADRTPEWRLEVARAVTAATIRSHFMGYLMYVLPVARLNAFSWRVAEVRGVEHLIRAHRDSNGAIIAVAHWELWLAGPFRLRRMWPITLLADVGATDYGVASQHEIPAFQGIHLVNSAGYLAAKTLLDHLRAGRMAMLAFDVALPPTSLNATTKTIPFLGQSVARFDTAAWLSVQTGKPVLFLSTHREGRRVVVDLSPALEQAPGLSPKQQVARLTALLYEVAENHVRRNPECWLTWSWLHTLVIPSKEPAVVE
jgi:lauroyl/myristoyl acyltransferase